MDSQSWAWYVLSMIIFISGICIDPMQGVQPGIDPENLKFFFEEIHRLTKA